MKHLSLHEPTQSLDLASGKLVGSEITESRRLIQDLAGVFADEVSRSKMRQDQLAYRVQVHKPVPDGCDGGLFFGTSYIEAGLVGSEYMMTKGHFHSRIDAAEYYWGIAGIGMLILMNESGETWAEYVRPGSLHYIPGRVAHRLANVSKDTLVVGACWPSDAGHDYSTIAAKGFTARLMQINGTPTLVDAAI